MGSPQYENWPEKKRNLCILIFFELLEIWTKILWENVWNKGLSSIEMETEGEGLDYAALGRESPQAPELRGKRRKKMDDNTSCNVA